MPQLPDGTQISPDDAMAKDLCPECAADLTKCHPGSHRNTHWQTPITIAREHDEARRRIALFDNWLKAHPEEPAKE